MHLSCRSEAIREGSAFGKRIMGNLLRKFAEDVKRAGLVGEEVNAQVVFLTAASAGLPRPLNLTVCGASAAEKNHLIETVARFFPPERKKFLTGMTRRR